MFFNYTLVHAGYKCTSNVLIKRTNYEICCNVYAGAGYCNINKKESLTVLIIESPHSSRFLFFSTHHISFFFIIIFFFFIISSSLLCCCNTFSLITLLALARALLYYSSRDNRNSRHTGEMIIEPNYIIIT